LKQTLTLPKNTAFFTTDGLGQIYVVTQDNEVQKWTLDAATPVIQRFSDKKLGKIKLIDATNPFFVVVFYDDFQTIVLLDRAMSPVQSFALADVGVAQAVTIGMSEQGDIWLFDAATNELKKMQRDGRQLIPAKTLIFPLPAKAQVTQIVARENVVYLNVPMLGIYTFDSFGKFLRKFDIKENQPIQWTEKQLIYRSETEFYKFHTVSLATIPLVTLPEIAKHVQQIRLERGKLFAKNGDVLSVFGF
jgi:hypothetical protein